MTHMVYIKSTVSGKDDSVDRNDLSKTISGEMADVPNA